MRIEDCASCGRDSTYISSVLLLNDGVAKKKEKSARHPTGCVAYPTMPAPKSWGSVCPPPTCQLRFVCAGASATCKPKHFDESRVAVRPGALHLSTFAFLRAALQWDPVTGEGADWRVSLFDILIFITMSLPVAP